MPANSANNNFCGYGLNVSESLATKNSLRKIALDANLSKDNVTFWGKITANRADYLVIQARSVTDKIRNTYYFSVDSGLTFAQLPQVDEWVASKAPKITGIFSGNPAYLLKDPDAPKKKPEDEEEEEADEENEENAKKDPPPRKLTELERLAWTVSTINNDTSVVPVGAWFMNPTGDVVKDQAYKGLTSEQAVDLSNYQLLRDPVQASTFARIRKQGVANIYDFLDVLTDDQPKGVWSVQVGEGGEAVSLKSLAWPGYEFKSSVGSSEFSGGYHGHGLKNDDVIFML